MEFLCRKTEPTPVAYVDVDGGAMPTRGYEVFFVPVTSQHEKMGGIADLQMTLFGRDCPYVAGQVYDLPL